MVVTMTTTKTQGKSTSDRDDELELDGSEQNNDLNIMKEGEIFRSKKKRRNNREE